MPRLSLYSLLLVGWLCIGVQCTSCNQEARVSLKIDIEPSKPYDCDEKECEQIGKYIQKVANKAFKEFAKRSEYVKSTSQVEFCKVGDPTNKSKKKNDRTLLRVMVGAGWKFLLSYDCKFCDSDNKDGSVVDRGGNRRLGKSNSDDAKTSVNLDAVASLKTKLEGQLTRQLGQKVNKHPKSCLGGTNSTVSISIDLVQNDNSEEEGICPDKK